MNEFFSSLLETLHRRATTAIIATYAVFWAVFHWQGFYTILFVDEGRIFEKFGMLKNEYLNVYFFGPDWTNLSFYVGYVVPAIATWLFIWVLPKTLFISAFKEERSYKLSRRKIVIDGDRQFEAQKEKLADQSTKTIKAQIKQTTAKKQIVALDPLKGLADEFEAFMLKPNSTKVLKDIMEAIYEHAGNTHNYMRAGARKYYDLDASSLARADSNNLITISAKDDKIALTEKGKYFISRFE